MAVTAQNGACEVLHDDRHQLLNVWFREYSDRVLAYLLHRTDQQTAEDLLQETFVVAFRKADEVPEPPLGWLFATARRLLANSRRGHLRKDVMMARLGEIETLAGGSGANADVHARWAFFELLARLSSRDREVLTLTGWYGLTASEAAAALECSAATYAVRLHRARQRLADLLNRAGTPGESPAHHLSEVLHVD